MSGGASSPTLTTSSQLTHTPPLGPDLLCFPGKGQSLLSKALQAVKGSASAPTLVTSWSALPTATGGERQGWEGIISKSMPPHSKGVAGPGLPCPWGQLTSAPTTSASSVQGVGVQSGQAQTALWLLQPQGQLSQLLEIAGSDGEGHLLSAHGLLSSRLWD